MARIFSQRPSRIVDPGNTLGSIFALEYDAFCAALALEMVSEGKLV